MAKFHSKYPIRLVVRGASTAVIPNPQGIPIAVTTPQKVADIKAGLYETNDAEIIERIKRDEQFGIAEGIMEFTEDDQEAVKIKERKHKEADEEIREMKRKKQQK